MIEVIDCGGCGEDIPEKRSLEGIGPRTDGCDGPDVSKRSMIELMLDCGGGEVVVGGEELPPRISARRSVLF